MRRKYLWRVIMTDALSGHGLSVADVLREFLWARILTTTHPWYHLDHSRLSASPETIDKIDRTGGTRLGGGRISIDHL